MTLNKIVCTHDHGEDCVVISAILATGGLEVRRLNAIKRRLENAHGSQLQNFASERDNELPGLYKISVSMNSYASEEAQIKEMMRFRAEIEAITKVPCCIDCSCLHTPAPKRKKAVRPSIRKRV